MSAAVHRSRKKLCADDAVCAERSVALFEEIKRKSQSAKSTKILLEVPAPWEARHSPWMSLSILAVEKIFKL